MKKDSQLRRREDYLTAKELEVEARLSDVDILKAEAEEILELKADHADVHKRSAELAVSEEAMTKSKIELSRRQSALNELHETLGNCCMQFRTTVDALINGADNSDASPSRPLLTGDSPMRPGEMLAENLSR